MSKVAVIKTKENEASVEDFLNKITEVQKRTDSFAITEMMKKATGEEPKMWGASMIGFGKLRYKSPTSGREVDWFKIGFSPRKANLSIHLIQINQDLLAKLGKHKAGSGCVYINKLADIDLQILEKMMHSAMEGK